MSDTTGMQGRDEELVMEARRAFWAVCQRARTCPHGTCRRRGLCLADDGGMKPELMFVGPWWQPTGGCPVTTEAEWKTVKLGIQANLRLLEPYFNKRSAEQKKRWDAEDRGLPEEERQRR